MDNKDPPKDSNDAPKDTLALVSVRGWLKSLQRRLSVLRAARANRRAALFAPIILQFTSSVGVRRAGPIIEEIIAQDQVMIDFNNEIARLEDEIAVYEEHVKLFELFAKTGCPYFRNDDWNKDNDSNEDGDGNGGGFDPSSTVSI